MQNTVVGGGGDTNLTTVFCIATVVYCELYIGSCILQVVYWELYIASCILGSCILGSYLTTKDWINIALSSSITQHIQSLWWLSW